MTDLQTRGYSVTPRTHTVSDRILGHLLQHRVVTGKVVGRAWRPASVMLAEAISGGARVATRSDRSHGTAAAFTLYQSVMEALSLLASSDMVRLDYEPSGEIHRITLV